MISPEDPNDRTIGSLSESEPDRSAVLKVDAEEVLKDFHAGMRTKHFLSKYGLTMRQFEEILKHLIRDGRISKDEFRDWKAHRVPGSTAVEGSSNFVENAFEASAAKIGNVRTYVIPEPEKNNSWALELFSTGSEDIRGAQFKVNLHGKRYSFVVEQMLFRGSVNMRGRGHKTTAQKLSEREEAMDFISKHGWAAYLENRAFSANFGPDGGEQPRKARLVLLHCRNHTYLAALHTPAPAINLYVSSSLENIRRRLAHAVDTRDIRI